MRELFVFLLYIIGIHVKKTVGDFKKGGPNYCFYFLLFILFFQPSTTDFLNIVHCHLYTYKVVISVLVSVCLFVRS